jgi:hypothetical protein
LHQNTICTDKKKHTSATSEPTLSNILPQQEKQLNVMANEFIPHTDTEVSCTRTEVKSKSCERQAINSSNGQKQITEQWESSKTDGLSQVKTETYSSAERSQTKSRPEIFNAHVSSDENRGDHTSLLARRQQIQMNDNQRNAGLGVPYEGHDKHATHGHTQAGDAPEVFCCQASSHHSSVHVESLQNSRQFPTQTNHELIQSNPCHAARKPSCPCNEEIKSINAVTTRGQAAKQEQVSKQQQEAKQSCTDSTQTQKQQDMSHEIQLNKDLKISVVHKEIDQVQAR